MEYRNGGNTTHHAKGMAFSVEEAEGVEVQGTTITSISDDAAADLTVKAKGNGALTIGHAANAVTIAGSVAMSDTTPTTVPAMAPGLTSGLYAGSKTLARLFQPALAAGGQAQGENAFGPGGGNSTMTNGASADLSLASNNTAMGFDALVANTTGPQNTAYGHRALKSNTTGQYNVAIGGGALLNETTNVGNVAVGTSALYTLTSGNYNTGIGHDALEFLQTGTLNTAVGKRANWQATSGDDNTVVGGDAMYSNLTGASNVAIGKGALLANLASNNTAIGASAMVSNTTGTENCAVGRAALLNTTTSDFNVALGNLAGRYQADGSTPLATATLSVYLGYQAQGFNNSDSNTIVIGANAKGVGANKATIGNVDLTDVYFGSGTAAAKAHASLFQTHTALITAVDGGNTAAFTANMVGATGGPATAAQHGWQKALDASGATVWIPVWK